MDYSKIEADSVRGPEIGRLYLDASPFVTSLARFAYRQFAAQVEDQFHELCKEVRVSFVKDDPYPSHAELFRDLKRGSFAVYATAAPYSHPLLTDAQNDHFRAVHDYYGHFGTGRGFDRHGEEAAWIRHSQMFSGLARRAMTTETRGQSSALCWVTSPEFPPQKAVLLPDWVSRIPERWQS